MISYIILLLYVIVGTVIALFSRRFLRRGDPVDYFVASHSLGGVVSALTYAATTYSAFMMIGLVGLAYATGIGALGFELAYLVATLILLSFIGSRLWSICRVRRYVSPTEFLSDRYGSKVVGLVATVIMMFSLIPYASIQIIGPSLVIEITSNGTIPYILAVVIATLLSIVWSLVGGLRGIAWTDVFQGIIMFVSAVAIVVWVFMWSGNTLNYLVSIGHEVVKFPNTFWTLSTFIAYTTPWIFFAMSNPQVIQRIFIPRNIIAYRRMVLGFAVFGFLYTVLTTLLGLLLRGSSEIGLFTKIDISRRSNWNLVTPILLALPTTPTLLSVTVGISILAAAVTTIDSIALTLSSMVSRDIYSRVIGHSRYNEVLIGKVVLVLICFVSAVFAYVKPSFIVDLAVVSSTMLLPFAILFIGGVLSRFGGKWCALTTMYIGFSTAVVLTVAKVKLIVPSSIIVLVVSLATYTITGLIEKYLKEG